MPLQLNISDYYIGAGAISQTIWNHLLNKDMSYGISDIDIVYYDADNIDKKFEEELREQLLELLGEFFCGLI